MEVANSSVPDTNSVSPANSHTPPSRGSHRRGLIAACFLFVGCVFGLAQAAHAQQPAPLVVDADQVTYDQVLQQVEATGNVRLQYRGIRLTANHVVFDLRQERLVARGDVVLIDQQGRELRGQSLTYDVRTDQAELFKADTVISRVFVRSERLQTMARRILGQDATLTTCDPARPAYRITAAQLEIIPGDRIIARRATLWVGQFRVLTLPVYVISLRGAEGTALSVPQFGYNTIDGAWLAVQYPYTLGSVSGTIYAKYGQLTKLIAHTVLTYGQPDYAITLVFGRNQTRDTRRLTFEQREAIVELPARRLGGLPFTVAASASAGWFRELAPERETSRWQYRLAVVTDPLLLGPRTVWRTWASWQDAFYGTGARQSVFQIDSSLTHTLDTRSSLALEYRVLEVLGATPFLFDSVPVDDRKHTLSLFYTRTGGRPPSLSTLFIAGATQNFRDRTLSLASWYGERSPDRYHWGLGVEYNLTTQAWALTTDSGLSLGRGTYFRIQATYNLTAGVFAELDYIVTSRICDCIDLSLKYRQARQEIWFEVGLTAFPESRFQFLLPPLR